MASHGAAKCFAGILRDRAVSLFEQLHPLIGRLRRFDADHLGVFGDDFMAFAGPYTVPWDEIVHTLCRIGAAYHPCHRISQAGQKLFVVIGAGHTVSFIVSSWPVRAKKQFCNWWMYFKGAAL